MLGRRVFLCVRLRVGERCEFITLELLRFRGSRFRLEDWIVMPLWNPYQDRVVSTFLLVILLQLLAQPVCLDSNDGIRLRVKVRPSPKCFDSDRVFLESL